MRQLAAAIRKPAKMNDAFASKDRGKEGNALREMQLGRNMIKMIPSLKLTAKGP